MVNPKQVVAVPTVDHYGKMRCCEYLPIGFSKRNEDGELEDLIDDGFEDDFSEYVNYEGEEGEDSNFQIKVIDKDTSSVSKTIQDLISEFEDFISKDVDKLKEGLE